MAHFLPISLAYSLISSSSLRPTSRMHLYCRKETTDLENRIIISESVMFVPSESIAFGLSSNLLYLRTSSFATHLSIGCHENVSPHKRSEGLYLPCNYNVLKCLG